MSRELEDAWRAWLGPTGSRPPPLDRFLAGRRVVDPHLVRGLHRRCAEATHRVAAVHGWAAVAPGGIALFDQLRALPRATGSRPPPAPSPLLEAGLPPGFLGPMSRRAAAWGDARWRAWLQLQTRRPPLWVRANHGDPSASLRADGFEVNPGPVAGAWRVRGDMSIRASAAWRSGAIEVQDLASQRVGLAVDSAPGMAVWDACAGEGGKTIQLAARSAGRGSVHATDIDARRLEVTTARARRVGAQNVRVRTWDGASIPDFGPEARRGFHRVLVDAPCTATGTWRRNPDARLRLDPADLARFADTQRDLLPRTAAAVRAGGRLVYATCSVLVEECEDVVHAAELPGFTLERCEHVGCPEDDADTLFVAVWRRAG